MQFGSVKCVQARQPVCVTLTSASIWSKFYIGVSLHVLDYINVTTGFMCLLNSWMCLRGQERCGFRANTNYIHSKKQSSDIYSFYCCIIKFSPHYSTWNSVLKLPLASMVAVVPFPVVSGWQTGSHCKRLTHTDRNSQTQRDTEWPHNVMAMFLDWEGKLENRGGSTPTLKPPADSSHVSRARPTTGM